MKIATTTVVLVLLFALTTKSCFFGVTNAQNSPVLDTDGDELRAGVPYHVISAKWDIFVGNGGLTLGRSDDQTCPGIVVQTKPSLIFVDNGTPVIFTIAEGGDDDVIRLNTDLFVEFIPGIDVLCESTVWKVDDNVSGDETAWLTTDGVKGKPSLNTLTSLFKIEKTRKNYYIFNYCPSACDSCGGIATLCDEVDRIRDGGQMRLGLGDSGWPWEFKKATKTIKQVNV
ncbi:Proteinase inhibitor I3, Kunitz legume [Corchorus olitorius]|uniref:Proteinase inhibitor I3, Kunitz legume n=1 Tax=Corchorus olitorius TaxID=93759 RepID=A0A1R3KTE8_9ROSI|nr:Proteinase inhibitor I3, Kunitz legume [Corchorus olitorius]